MHKVIKSLTNTQFEFDRKLFREVEGLNSFFDDVIERLEQRRDINPAFIDDITLLTSVTAKELPELKNLVKDLVWDYFDKCNFHTLSYMWAALCEEDPQMHQDITLVYTYRFIEAIIEAQHANVLTTETCSVIPELFMALRINNPEAWKAYEQMLLNYFDAEPAEYPTKDEALNIARFINSSVGPSRTKSNSYIFGLLSAYMKENMMTVRDLLEFSQLLNWLLINQKEIAIQILEYVVNKGYSAEMLIEELGVENAVHMFTLLIEHAGKVDSLIFVKIAERILDNARHVGHYVALHTYSVLLKTEQFDPDVKNKIAASYSNRLKFLRENTYLNQFKTHKGFLHTPVDRDNTNKWNQMLDYEEVIEFKGYD